MQLDDILNKEPVQQGSNGRNEPYFPIKFVFPQQVKFVTRTVLTMPQKFLPSIPRMEPKNTEIHDKPRTKYDFFLPLS